MELPTCSACTTLSCFPPQLLPTKKALASGTIPAGLIGDATEEVERDPPATGSKFPETASALPLLPSSSLTSAAASSPAAGLFSSPASAPAHFAGPSTGFITQHNVADYSDAIQALQHETAAAAAAATATSNGSATASRSSSGGSATASRNSSGGSATAVATAAAARTDRDSFVTPSNSRYRGRRAPTVAPAPVSDASTTAASHASSRMGGSGLFTGGAAQTMSPGHAAYMAETPRSEGRGGWSSSGSSSGGSGGGISSYDDGSSSVTSGGPDSSSGVGLKRGRLGEEPPPTPGSTTSSSTLAFSTNRPRTRAVTHGVKEVAPSPHVPLLQLSRQPLLQLLPQQPQSLQPPPPQPTAASTASAGPTTTASDGSPSNHSTANSDDGAGQILPGAHEYDSDNGGWDGVGAIMYPLQQQQQQQQQQHWQPLPPPQQGAEVHGFGQSSNMQQASTIEQDTPDVMDEKAMKAMFDEMLSEEGNTHSSFY